MASPIEIGNLVKALCELWKKTTDYCLRDTIENIIKDMTREMDNKNNETN